MAKQSIVDGYFNFEVIAAYQTSSNNEAWGMLHSFHGEPLHGISDTSLNHFYHYLSIALDIDPSSLNVPIIDNPKSHEAKQLEDRWVASLRKFTCTFQDIPLFERTVRVCWAAVRLNPKDFCYVPDSIKTVDLCLLAMEKEPSMLFFMPDHLLSHELYRKAVSLDSSLIHRVPEHHQKKDVWLAAVTKNGLILRYCPLPLLTPDILDAAVHSNGAAIAFVPQRLLTARLCHLAISSNPHGATLENIPRQFHTERIRIQAVANKPMTLSQIPTLEQTAEVRLVAVQSDGKSIQFIPTAEQTKLVCFHALLNTLDCHPWVSPEYLYEGVLLQQQFKPDSRFPKNAPDAVRKLVQAKCSITELLSRSYLSQFTAAEIVPQIVESIQNAKALSSVYEEEDLISLFRKMKVRGALFGQALNL